MNRSEFNRDSDNERRGMELIAILASALFAAILGVALVDWAERSSIELVKVCR